MTAEGQAGRVEAVMLKSRILNRRCTVLVYKSPGWQRGRGRLVYLLHGMHGSEIDWVYKGGVHETADRLVHEGRLRPLAIVMPNDGMDTDGTFYTNWYDGSGRYEDYFVKDMQPRVEEYLGFVGGRSRRAIAGLSMGGYGALALGLRHPKLFCAAASLSGAVEPVGREQLGGQARRMFGPRRGEYCKQRDPAWLLAARRSARTVAVHVNCGRDDFLIEPNRRFHQRLVESGIKHEYKEYPGAHTWPYWRKRIVPVLAFLERQWEAAAGR